MRPYRTAPLVVACAIATLPGCTGPRTFPAFRTLVRFHDAVRTRTEASFSKAILYKPRDVDADDPNAALLPLLVFECVGDGESSTDPEQLTLCTEARTVSARDDRYSLLRYRWRDPPEVDRPPVDSLQTPSEALSPTPASPTNSPSGEGRSGIALSDGTSVTGIWHTLSITVGRDGFPLVFEVQGNSSRGGRSVRVLFVASSLEQEARERFGPPLSGRRYSVERSVSQTPYVVVAGVVEDGPIPLGPYIYVNVGGNVTTILCRCAPAQVDEFKSARYYHHLAEGVGSCTTGGDNRDGRRTVDDHDPTVLLRWPID